MKPLLLILLCLFGISAGAADPQPESTASFVVHILGYIRKDYPAAVADGKITSAAEYQEQIDFVTSALQTAKALPVLSQEKEVLGGLEQLRGEILKKAPAEAIAASTLKIERKVISVAGIEVAPLRWPDRRMGQTAFAANCASCHGSEGRGDGPSGAKLDPKPSNFHDESMEGMSPFQAFNTIRMGVPGTGMAAFSNFSDREVWDLAFYVIGLRHEGRPTAAAQGSTRVNLADVSNRSDADLIQALEGTADQKARALSELRLRVPSQDPMLAALSVARSKLKEAADLVRSGDRAAAKQAAVMAYLDGVEPIEPRLRAKDSDLVTLLEERMADVRGAIDAGIAAEPVQRRVEAAIDVLARAQEALQREEASPTISFWIAAGIFTREAFEAVLILVTLLGVIRSIGSRRAAMFVHGGWLAAVGVGLIAWFFSGWVMAMSGVQREFLEGIVSLLAVTVLLYFGFWLHRKTEIDKWRAFISDMVKTAVEGRNLFALGAVAFMAVFREAFETVLFLRALLLEAGPSHGVAVAGGVLVSFIFVVFLAAALVKFSVKIPVRQLFGISSLVLVSLSLILIGKAVHSFQETGLLSMTELPFRLRSDLVGLYPTYESVVPQILVLGISVAIWLLGRRGRPVPRESFPVNARGDVSQSS